jgi:hypothetical protein
MATKKKHQLSVNDKKKLKTFTRQNVYVLYCRFTLHHQTKHKQNTIILIQSTDERSNIKKINVAENMNERETL